MPPPKDLVRFQEVRRADQLDDQKSPSQISNAVPLSDTQEQLQEFILSQIKRIIWGDDPGVWNSDFINLGVFSLATLSGLGGGGGGPAIETEDADCQATDAVGMLVHIAAPLVAGRMQVTRADPTNVAKMPAVAIIVEKPTATTCKIKRAGRAAAMGLTTGKMYFVGTSGFPSVTPPAPLFAGYAFTQPIGVALDASTLLVMPTLHLTKRYG